MLQSIQKKEEIEQGLNYCFVKHVIAVFSLFLHSTLMCDCQEIYINMT